MLGYVRLFYSRSLGILHMADSVQITSHHREAGECISVLDISRHPSSTLRQLVSRGPPLVACSVCGDTNTCGYI